MNTYFAHPYNIDASGFYFKTIDAFQGNIHKVIDCHGNAVEEFEIQWIDGEELDRLVFEALCIGQCDIKSFIEKIEDWTDEEKLKLILIGQETIRFDIDKNDPDDYDISLYYDMEMQELAELFVDERLFGDIEDRLMRYLDYDKIARDLSYDYTETCINGQNIIYRMS